MGWLAVSCECEYVYQRVRIAITQTRIRTHANTETKCYLRNLLIPLVLENIPHLIQNLHERQVMGSISTIAVQDFEQGTGAGTTRATRGIRQAKFRHVAHCVFASRYQG